MNIFYIMGASWGHLRRAQVFIENEGIENYRIVTSNKLAHTIFDSDLVFNGTLSDIEMTMVFHKTGTFFIDVFPCGIQGELSNIKWPPGWKINVLCRRIKWDKYKKFAQDMPIDKAYRMEVLEEDHYDYLRMNAKYIRPYELKYPKAELNDKVYFNIHSDVPIWLVVHGYVKDEVEKLCHLAVEKSFTEQPKPRIILISDQPVDVAGIDQIGHFPASDFFPYVNKIFSGCGFNIMQETKQFRDKQVIIPFERVYDDQFWRYNQLKIK